MNLADQYAKALHELVSEHPDRSDAYLVNLRQSLKRRDHEKLLPRIFEAYKIIESGQARRTRVSQTTPETRRTRMLVELYKKLLTA
jgi:hypothetical protein